MKNYYHLWNISQLNLHIAGGIGNWKDHFSEELSKIVDEAFSRDMGDLKLDFIYT